MILPLLLACHQTDEYVLAIPKQPNTNNVDTANPNWNENIDEENIDEENNTEENNEESRDEELEMNSVDIHGQHKHDPSLWDFSTSSTR